MKRLILVLDEPSPDCETILQRLKALRTSPIRPRDEKEFRSLLLLQPDLILVKQDHLQNWGRFIKDIDHKRGGVIPVVAYGQTISRQKRLACIQQGCDTLITSAALKDSPDWMLALYARPLPDPIPIALPQPVREGIALFNQGKFHECHDVIEPHWLQEKNAIRTFYASLLQIGIAYYLLEHGKSDAAERMFLAGRLKLRHFQPFCLGVDTRRLLETVLRDEKSAPTEKPQIYFVPIPAVRR